MRQDICELTPEMIQQVLLEDASKGRKQTLQNMFTSDDVPECVKKAVTCLQQSTSNLLGSDGHRRQLRFEGQAYTLSFGPPLIFVTPNVADTKQMLLLVVQGEEFKLQTPVDATCRDMAERLARDPVGQVLVFELMIRLFFEYVLGCDPHAVGWRRGECAGQRAPARRFGLRFDGHRIGMCGKVAAAFGPIEAQGRGSLHPHILVWLLLNDVRETLEMLLKDRDEFQQRISRWMHQLMASIASIQHSDVISPQPSDRMDIYMESRIWYLSRCKAWSAM